MHLVDVYNMIEAFRENGLNTLDHNTELHETRLEAIVSSIFYALNKRLPTTSYIDVERSISLVTNWLLYAYDRYKFWLILTVFYMYFNCKKGELCAASSFWNLTVPKELSLSELLSVYTFIIKGLHQHVLEASMAIHCPCWQYCLWVGSLYTCNCPSGHQCTLDFSLL